MKKLLALLVFLTPTASFADITSSISSSVKLEVSAAATAADRIGNSYSVSGRPVKFIKPVFVSESGGDNSATVKFSLAAL